MRIAIQKPLFAWDCLEDHPSLVTLRRLFESIPDGPLLEGLRTWRGRGRNDYPVTVLWRVIVLTIALRHRDFEACLGELRRNPTLQQLIGIEAVQQIPQGHNVSRFLDVLGQNPHRSRLQDVFNVMVQRLGIAVPDLGEDTAGDSTWLNARRLRRDAAAAEKAAAEKAAAEKTAAEKPALEKAASAKMAAQQTTVTQAAAGQGASEPSGADSSSQPKEKILLDEHGLPQPSGGRKEYTDDQGQVTRVVEWFGYKLHLLGDVRHEVSLAYRISSTKAGDNELLPELVDQSQANLPRGRIKTLAYDKAADDLKVHQKLHAAGIRPVIQNRSLWKQETEQMLPGHDGNSNIVYDEGGTLHCYNRVSQPIVRQPMAYIGHEPKRGTLKYRCPAKHGDWECPMSSVCNADKTYGLTVRVKQELDLRRFPSIPRATKQFERLYKGRTSAERIIARLKIFWGADDGNVTGAVRFHALVGTVMIVHEAFATVLASLPRREGTLGKMRLSPIAQALDDQLRGVAREPAPRRVRRTSASPRQPRLFR
ncbi:MAG: transposase [Pirellulaceae bacterium]|jgi:hypothetical protein|nr:transposase [Pirellulaceae bacterium]